MGLAIIGPVLVACATTPVPPPHFPSGSGLTEAPASTTPAALDPWRAELVARPLDVLDQDLGDICPASSPGAINGAAVLATGEEPIHVQGIGPGISWRDGPVLDGRRYGSARWLSAPDYDGPVLLRGGRIGTGEPLAFLVDGQAPAEEHWLTTATATPPDESSWGPDWRTWVAAVGISEPGCYAIQVDGVMFSFAIVFLAEVSADSSN
jgi:hypothetical protein